MRTRFPAVVTSVVLCLTGCIRQTTEVSPKLGQFTLADKGQTRYVITLAAGHSVAEQHAAEELACFLKEVTGAEFPIVAPTARGACPTIAVGPGAARQIIPDLDLAGLGRDGIVIQSCPPHLILTGGSGAPRGTLYAVYTFLEDTVGCRWWTKDEKSIPKRATLVIPELAERQVPTLEYREPFWFVAFDRDWAVRNKCNSSIADKYPQGRQTLDEMRGGNGFKWAADQGCHTFNYIVPPEEYFPKHPEWFSEIDGKRLGPPAISQWCLTNPELLAFCIQRVKEMLRNEPPDCIVSVSQNDCLNRCQCANCLAVEKEEGSASGPVLRFVNAVADAIKDEYPQALVDTFAYNYTQKPPRLTKARPNVVVRLCSIRCSFLKPMESDTDEGNRDFVEDLKGWAAVCSRLYIWNYGMEFFIPYPNQRSLGPNYRFFVRNNVKGIFEEGNYISSGSGFGGLEAWVQAKLMWDPAADDRALVRQFVEGYYGPAASMITEYLELLHDTAEKTNCHLACMASVTAPYLTVDFLTQAEALFQTAEAAVKDSPDHLRRVRLAHAGIRFTVLSAWPTLRQDAQSGKKPWPFGPFKDQLDPFMDVCRDNGVSYLTEDIRATPESFRLKFELKTGPGVDSSTPEVCKGLPDTDWVDFQEDAFPSDGVMGAVRPDPAASNGKATWMPSTHREWAVQLYLPISLWMTDVNQEWKTYVVVRAEKKGQGDGTAFSYGMYDVTQSKEIAKAVTVNLAEIKDDSYHVYEVAQTGVSYARYIWVAPTMNPDNVAGIWVDRIFMVKATMNGK